VWSGSARATLPQLVLIQSIKNYGRRKGSGWGGVEGKRTLEHRSGQKNNFLGRWALPGTMALGKLDVYEVRKFTW